MRRHWTFSLYGPGMVYFDFFFWSSNGTFLIGWSYVSDGETNEPGYLRLLPTSDIAFKLSAELVRAARRTVESGISSLCDVTFRMRRVTLNWNNIWNDLFWDTCASEDILVEYIAYYIHLGVRLDGIFGIFGWVWIQCNLYKSISFPSWNQSSI